MMLIMRKNRYRKVKAINKRNLDKTLVSLLVIFLLGTVLGAYSINLMGTETIEHMDQIAKSYINIRKSQNLKEIFLSIFLPNAIIIVLVCLIGKTRVLGHCIWTFPLLEGIGFGVFALFLMKTTREVNVKLIAFTLLQERFWTVLVLILVCMYIIKTGTGSKYRCLNSKSTIAEIILSILLIGFASGLSAFIVFKLGIPLLG